MELGKVSPGKGREGTPEEKGRDLRLQGPRGIQRPVTAGSWEEFCFTGAKGETPREGWC